MFLAFAFSRIYPTPYPNASQSNRASASANVVSLALLFSFGAFGEDAAPPSPERPWSPPRLDKYERELAQEGARERPDAAKVAINPKKVYDLPELIDLAERNNPTRRLRGRAPARPRRRWASARVPSGLLSEELRRHRSFQVNELGRIGKRLADGSGSDIDS